MEVIPGRPHAVDEYTIVSDETGETTGWTAVIFDATATSTAIKADLGLDNEPIADARWFDDLPDEVFHPLTETVYRRCEERSR